MKYVVFAAAIALVLTGCSTLRRADSAAVIQFSEINKQAQRARARVILTDGQQYRAFQLQVTMDSTSWFDPKTGRVRSVATGAISEITFIRKGRGALQGLGIGLVVGALSGAFLGLVHGDDPPCGESWICFRFTAQQKAMIGAVSLGSLGGAVGSLTGAILGSKNRYRFGQRAPGRPADLAPSPQPGQ